MTHLRKVTPLLFLLAADQIKAAPGFPSESKLSVHLLANYTSGAEEIIRARPRVLKILGTHSAMVRAARDYKAAAPDGVVVLRIYTPEYWSQSESPSASATNFWETVLEPAVSGLSDSDRALIDYLEGPNEGDSTPTWASAAETVWYNTFWLHLAPLIADAGFRPLAYSISVGNPPGSIEEIHDSLDRIAPSLRLVHQLGGGWSYHAYSIPYGTNASQEIWYSLRYRQYYAYFNTRYPDLADLPLVLTEGGIDGDGPWSTRGDQTKYHNWLAWFDSELLKDDYCLGVTLFQIGDTGDWGGFNVEPIAGWLADYLESNPGTAPVPELRTCVREEPTTWMLQFTEPVHASLAMDPANYTIHLNGSNTINVLSAQTVNPTNVVLTTTLPLAGADYTVVASNLVHALAEPGDRFLNGQAVARVPMELIPLHAESLWRYDQRGMPLGVFWRAPFLNDASWQEGAPLFGLEDSPLPEAIRTPFTVVETKLTYYFRKWFEVPANLLGAGLRVRTILDDGAVFYLNSAEIMRVGMPSGIVNYDTLASRTVGNAVWEGPFLVNQSGLVAGDNLLAVEVHQASATSSDVVFGMALEALVLPSQVEFPLQLRASWAQNDLVLEWDEPAELQSAERPSGPWHTMVDAMSPLGIATTNEQAYFRLRRASAPE